MFTNRSLEETLERAPEFRTASKIAGPIPNREGEFMLMESAQRPKISDTAVERWQFPEKKAEVCKSHVEKLG